jgi:hypothetical protein
VPLTVSFTSTCGTGRFATIRILGDDGAAQA